MSPPPRAAPPSPRRAWIPTLALAGHAGVPLRLAPLVPTMDGPSHLYEGRAVADAWRERRLPPPGARVLRCE